MGKTKSVIVDDMDERWKDVTGFEGYYQVSNNGRVRSVGYINGLGKYIKRSRMLNPWDNGKGYKVVTFQVGCRRKNKYVHRLVAEHFVDNPLGHTHVNHIDFDASNNSDVNLEWCTQRHNVLYSSNHMKKQHNTQSGKSGIRYVHLSKNGKYRVCIPKGGADRRFDSLSDAIRYRDEVLYGIGYTV